MKPLSFALLVGCSAAPPTFKLDAAAARTQVEVRSGLPVVTAAVLGPNDENVPVELVLDLGADLHATLTPEPFARAAQTPETAGGTRRFANIRGDVLEAEMKTIRRLTFLGIRRDDLTVSEAVWHPGYAPPVRLGILGHRFFHGLEVGFDLGAGQMFARISEGVPVECHPIKLDQDVRIQVQAGDQSYDAVLDTAATHTFVLEPSAQNAELRFAGHSIQTGKRIQMEAPGGIASMFMDAPDIVLGLPFFQAHRVAIDFRNRCIAIDP